MNLKEKILNFVKGGTIDIPEKMFTSLNISDKVKYNWQMCDKMNDYIAQLPHAKYCGCIGLKMPKRPGSNMMSKNNIIFGEPIWIWQKGNKTNLNELFVSSTIEEW